MEQRTWSQLVLPWFTLLLGLQDARLTIGPARCWLAGAVQAGRGQAARGAGGVNKSMCKERKILMILMILMNKTTAYANNKEDLKTQTQGKMLSRWVAPRAEFENWQMKLATEGGKIALLGRNMHLMTACRHKQCRRKLKNVRRKHNRLRPADVLHQIWAGW